VLGIKECDFEQYKLEYLNALLRNIILWNLRTPLDYRIVLSAIKIRNDVQTAKQSKTRRRLAASQARMNKTGIITMRRLSATILKKDPITTHQ